MNAVQSMVVFRRRYALSKGQREWIRRAVILAALASLALLLSATFADSMVDEPTEASAAVSTAATARAELPREWRWTRKPIRFDSMYSDGTAAQPKLDWIQSSGAANR